MIDISAANAIIALLSGIIGPGVIIFYLRRNFSRIDKLENTVTRLKDEQIAGIDKRLDSHIRNDKTITHTQKFETMGDLKIKLEKHIENDKSQEILNEIKNVRGAQQRFENKLDTIADETAEQRAKIAANEKYIGNLDGSFQLHKANHK